MRVIRKLLWRDLKNGYYQARYKMMLFACLLIASVLLYGNTLDKGFLEGSYLSNASLGDLIQYIFLGPHITPSNLNGIFRLPTVWLGFHMIIAYLVGDYISDDLTGFGLTFLIFSKRRFFWWVSKFVWVLCFVTSLYLLTYVILLIGSFLYGFSITLSITPTISTLLFLNDYSTATVTEFITIYFLLPLFTSYVISVIQIVMVLLVKPILTYVAIISMFIISIYVTSPILITNCAIPARNAMYIDNGINTKFSFFFLAVLLFIFFFIGALVLEHRDFLERIE